MHPRVIRTLKLIAGLGLLTWAIQEIQCVLDFLLDLVAHQETPAASSSLLSLVPSHNDLDPSRKLNSSTCYTLAGQIMQRSLEDLNHENNEFKIFDRNRGFWKEGVPRGFDERTKPTLHEFLPFQRSGLGIFD